MRIQLARLARVEGLVGQLHLAAWAIWRREVFVAIRCKRWKTLAIATTVWRRWLPSLPRKTLSIASTVLATVATQYAKWRCPVRLLGVFTRRPSIHLDSIMPKFQLDRSAVIKAKPNRVFEVLADYQTWTTWSLGCWPTRMPKSLFHQTHRQSGRPITGKAR